MRPRPGEAVSVRPYPFPFRAAFALNNDVDAMSRAAFEDWHAFVCGEAATPYGEGLGLEVADSFWVWGGPTDILALHRCWPDVPDPPLSPDADRIVELGRAGWLDTLHSLGNWRPPEDGDRRRLGRRAEAEYALRKLDQLGIKPRVFVNHSSSPSNVGAIWGTYQRADDLDHPLYCMDLYRDFGFRYYWLDPCRVTDKFGDHLAFRDDGEMRAFVETLRWADWLRKPGKRVGEDEPALPTDAPALRRMMVSAFNETLFQVPSRDGPDILVFKRFGGRETPSSTSFPLQVTAQALDELEARRGAVVIYQHFGVTSLRGRKKSKAPGASGRSRPPVLDEHAVARWRDIAARRDAGRLFVATTSRLLDWLWMRDRLAIGLERNADRWVIRLGAIRCPVLGHRPPTSADLNGLALLVPADAPEVRVIGHDGGAFPMRREPDPHHPGRHALYRSWRGLVWPPDR